jgi:hypothetical protein
MFFWVLDSGVSERDCCSDVFLFWNGFYFIVKIFDRINRIYWILFSRLSRRKPGNPIASAKKIK